MELIAAAFASQLFPGHFLDQFCKLSIRQVVARPAQTLRDVGANCLSPEVSLFFQGPRPLVDAHARRGRFTVNVVPLSSDDSTCIVPLWACTIRSAM